MSLSLKTEVLAWTFLFFYDLSLQSDSCRAANEKVSDVL